MPQILGQFGQCRHILIDEKKIQMLCNHYKSLLQRSCTRKVFVRPNSPKEIGSWYGSLSVLKGAL